MVGSGSGFLCCRLLRSFLVQRRVKLSEVLPQTTRSFTLRANVLLQPRIKLTDEDFHVLVISLGSVVHRIKLCSLLGVRLREAAIHPVNHGAEPLVVFQRSSVLRRIFLGESGVQAFAFSREVGMPLL